MPFEAGLHAPRPSGLRERRCGVEALVEEEADIRNLRELDVLCEPDAHTRVQSRARRAVGRGCLVETSLAQVEDPVGSAPHERLR